MSSSASLGKDAGDSGNRTSGSPKSDGSCPATSARVLIASKNKAQAPEQVSKRKQPKSRNGCLTCKRKRMKCDEMKPSCQQCSSRGIKCHGYAKNLKWRHTIHPRHLNGQSESKLESQDHRHTTTMPTDKELQQLPGGLEDYPSSPNPAQFAERDSVFGHDRDVFIQSPSMHFSSSITSNNFGSSHVYGQPVSTLPGTTRFQAVGSDPAASSGIYVGGDCLFNDNDTEVFYNPHPSERTRGNFGNQSLNLDYFDAFLSSTEPENAFQDQQASQLNHLHLGETSVTSIPQGPFEWRYCDSESVDVLPVAIQEDRVEEDTQSLSEPCPTTGSRGSSGEFHSPHRNPLYAEDFYTLYQQPLYPSDSPEMIGVLFENKTCKILSIKEGWSSNPWKTLIWPLAQNNPPLYHALAAMTCLHMGKTHPQLYKLGTKHFQHSMGALMSNSASAIASIDAAIATRLALGFAETWDHQKSSTGIDHIKCAKILLQQALSKGRTSRLPTSELSRLTFLANTWTYMDVIARLTSADHDSVIDFEFMASCSQLSSVPPELQIDPLMGCAVTLFPIIGRVADIIARIRRRNAKRNTPATISGASDLRLALEFWVPPVDLKKSGPASNILDSIQTAEAYRWAALLLLRQGVPELPNLIPLWELAQKIMVFLATVSLTSPTTIVQIFPLMAAGCEATEEEDREWVRQRWSLMSRHMVTGIVDRCKRVTEEVWRRRDEYEVPRGLSQKSGAKEISLSMSTSGNSSTVNTSTDPAAPGPLQGDSMFHSTNSKTANRSGLEARIKHIATDFPISVALKNDVDIVTSGGCADYAVTGKLHWLAVMEDWKWEVMLG